MPATDAPAPPGPLVDLDAEMAVLGSLLREPERVLEVADLLRPSDFYREAHGLIYQHALNLSRNGGLDAVRLGTALQEAGISERVGGLTQLVILQETVALPKLARYHAERVLALSQRRALQVAARKVMETAADERLPVDGLAAQLANALPAAPGEGVIETRGLGYVGRFGPWELSLTRLREARGDLSGELQVCHLRPPLLGPACLAVTRISLVNLSSRAQLAKHLAEQRQGDWLTILNAFALGVLERERQDTDSTWVGMGEDEPLEYLLEPLLQSGQPTLLFGPGGTGKTTLAAAVALSLETGEALLPGMTPIVARVLVLDWETTPQAWSRTIKQLCRGAGLPQVAIRYKKCDRPLTDIVEEVARAADEAEADCLVLDSVGMALGSTREGGDANETAIRLFRALRLLGRTSLLIDHVKGDDVRAEGQVAKAYGSVYKSNAARSVWELRAEREQMGDGRRELMLVHNKVNEGPRHSAIGLAMHYFDTDDGTPVIQIRSAHVAAPELRGAMTKAEQMWEVLADGAMDAGDIAKELGTTPATVRSILKRDGGRRFIRVEWGGKPMIGRAFRE